MLGFLVKKLKLCGVYFLCVLFAVSGCQSGPGSGLGVDVGPELSSFFESEREAKIDKTKKRLDVVIPVFDPGLSESAKNYEDDGVWPELRRAESNRFAYQLKVAMDNLDAFGAVRVTPDATATADLYALGEILESNGEDVKIRVKVADMTGKHWFTRTFKHSVPNGFYKNIRNKGTDPYDPVFVKAANRIAIELEDYNNEDLKKIRQVTELRFASSFSEDTFLDHLLVEQGRYAVRTLPSESDPMLRRTRGIRVRDQLFVDGLQENYQAFSKNMEASYFVWQEQSSLELEAKREKDAEAFGEAIFGILAIGVAIAAIAAGSNSNSPGGTAVAQTGAIAAGAAGAVLLSNSFRTSEEAKIHREALEELGESIDIELGPKVVEFEDETVELTGTAREQFSKWRDFLKKIYDQERTPDEQF